MFQGFCDQTVDFLYGIWLNNDRDWFTQHKEDYQIYLQAPMQQLAREVFDGVMKHSPDRELLCKVARIYRDARRCHDGRPYKTSLWFSFLPPADNWEDAPGFWFELSRDSWSCGMGMYAPKSATMAFHRSLIDTAPQRLLELDDALSHQREFRLEGRRYAREKPCPVPQLTPWYNLKDINLIHTGRDLSETFDGPKLVRRLVKGFRFLLPYYDYLLHISRDAP